MPWAPWSGRQLPFFSLIVPFLADLGDSLGIRATLSVWPAILVCGVSFAGKCPQFMISNYVNPWIVDISAARLFRCCALAGFLQVWHPAEIWHSPALRSHDKSAATMPLPVAARSSATTHEIRQAWIPWVILSVVVAVWGTQAFKNLVNPIFTWNYPVAGLHNLVQKVPPVVAKPAVEGAVFAPLPSCPIPAPAS